MITDYYHRSFDYLRVALNEKCNFRCMYCMPSDGIQFKPLELLLTDDEIFRILSVLAGQGVSKIRLTGGEPLIRKDIARIINTISKTDGVKSVHITTNGTYLDLYYPSLVEAGLTGINISLDTLKEDRFYQITRKNEFPRVWHNIRSAIRRGKIPVKINVVLMRGINDDEIPDFVNLAREYPVSVRFIELMPFDDHQIWKTGRFMGVDMILSVLKKIMPTQQIQSGTLTEQYYFKPEGFSGAVAIIPSFSRSFCSSCNRIRLTADGQIRNCLYSNREFNIRDLIRNGCSDDDILSLVQIAMHQKKKDGFEAEKADDHIRNSMTQIGG